MNASAGARRPSNDAATALTHVELTWLEKRIEHWIRFGRIAEEKILDRRRRIVSFPPGGAFVRWALNDFGTIISCIRVVRAVASGEPYATLPFGRPGGDILLRINGWPKVNQALQAIVPHRLTAGEQPSPNMLLVTRPGSCAGASRRDRPRRRQVAITLLGVSAMALPQLDNRAPWLVWNASASVPIGLYAVAKITKVRAGDLVVVRPPESLAGSSRRRISSARRPLAEARGGARQTDSLAASAAASSSTQSKWATPSTATAMTVLFLSGRATGLSLMAKWASRAMETCAPFPQRGRNGADAEHAKDIRRIAGPHHLGPDAYNPRDNILAGAAYLREMPNCSTPGSGTQSCSAGATGSRWFRVHG